MGRDSGREAGKPRGKMSSYAYFVQTCREEHKKKHPDASVNFSEFSRKCSERWKTMSVKEKGKFEDMAKQDKVRYDQEMMNTSQPKEARRRRSLRTPMPPRDPRERRAPRSVHRRGGQEAGRAVEQHQFRGQTAVREEGQQAEGEVREGRRRVPPKDQGGHGVGGKGPGQGREEGRGRRR
ncbi:unnamed protein product [Tetraodon nigroviridis]|uniref:Chromosome 7 SCAF14601, whole genome shotgun sequence n=1 Tax=Tetraodon nigroviridis TaxID=99883 RepID=Q4SG21_TETNG|nr:unnamed protein product [Tetraodon nigroviridis]